MKITRRQLRSLILEACGCGGSPEPEPLGQWVDEDEHVDVDWERPGYGRAYGNIDDMSPQEAFALGFSMGSSGDFDDVSDSLHPSDVEPLGDSWSGGDNLERDRDNPLSGYGCG